MKAIEILFDKIDDLNTQLKSADKIFNKVQVVNDIHSVSNIIMCMVEQFGSSINDEDYI
jgi:hypothetical protein